MKQIYIDYIARMMSVRDWQVSNCVSLIEEGNTIPFISRYRKEKTGGLDDAQVAEIKHWTDVFSDMEKRKKTICETIGSLGKLTDEMRERIENCTDASELEDLYLPYRPKRRTKATAAREAGLEPLAEAMSSMKSADPEKEAAGYLNDKVPSVEDALAGARDIIAESVSENAEIRDALRKVFRMRKIVTKASKAASSPDAQKYKNYFDYSEPLSRMAPHRLLAILRAENDGFLTVKIDADAEKSCGQAYYLFTKGKPRPSRLLSEQINLAIADAYSRLLVPSLTGEVLREYKQKADEASIGVFGDNLRQLLLAPPVGQKRTMAIDPGFRNGCKIACLDENGALLHHEIIFPHPPKNEKVKSIMAVTGMIDKYKISAIAIGNGTASRETEDFVKKINLPPSCRVYVVSEDGASIYSASEAARAEFPDEDVTVRGAVSIGRRLMDPLSELVKIDPKSLGVGQYQHDVDQKLLKEKLDNVVESCVNSVGVNLNTASPYLLRYVAGIGPALAAAIVEYRAASGGFDSRSQLLKVPRLGGKAFQQCAGFLRIKGGSDPLDDSAVHPEAYHIVDKMARDLGVSSRALVGNAELCSRIEPQKYVEADFGLPTISDIIKELAKPGLDPRQQAEEFSFDDSIRSIEDLSAGMELPGIVTNITAFGAFVDIGVHENGLVHISRMRGRQLKLHEHIRVCVLDVDMDRRRIALKLC